MVVEELLQLLVGEVDAQLLETVLVEDLKTGNIEHTDEVLSLLLGVQGLVQLLHHPLEETIEHGLSEGTDRVGDLSGVSALGHKLIADLDARLAQVLVQISGIEAKQVGGLLTLLRTVRLALLLARTLLELHRTNVHDSGRNAVDVKLLLSTEAKNVKSFLKWSRGKGKVLLVVILLEACQ